MDEGKRSATRSGSSLYPELFSGPLPGLPAQLGKAPPPPAPSVPPAHWLGALSLGPRLRERGATSALVAAGWMGGVYPRRWGAIVLGYAGSPAAVWGAGEPLPRFTSTLLWDPWTRELCGADTPG